MRVSHLVCVALGLVAAISLGFRFLARDDSPRAKTVAPQERIVTRESLLQAAHRLMAEERWQEAVESLEWAAFGEEPSELDQLLSDTRDRARADLMCRAYESLLVGDHTTALILLRRAGSLAPHDREIVEVEREARFHQALAEGRAHLALDRLQPALVSLTLAHELRPADPEVRELFDFVRCTLAAQADTLGELALAERQFDEARVQFTESARVSGHSELASRLDEVAFQEILDRAERLILQGEVLRGLSQFRHAADLRPFDRSIASLERRALAERERRVTHRAERESAKSASQAQAQRRRGPSPAGDPAVAGHADPSTTRPSAAPSHPADRREGATATPPIPRARSSASAEHGWSPPKRAQTTTPRGTGRRSTSRRR